MPSEFELIRRHFTRPVSHTVLGVGDDAALMRLRPGMQLVASTDMLVEGVHFTAGTDAGDLGWKSLAVNLSDLAAMAAEPRWALLALAIPAPEERWLAAFSEGLFRCAQRYSVDVAGGDTTRGPLTIAVTVFGEVPAGQALRREGARPGDDVWVSGRPGTAALGLAASSGRIALDAQARSRSLGALQRPQPRVELGLALRDLASAAIDVSDGLVADLGHIAERSAVCAELHDDWLPWAELATLTPDTELARQCLLAGGDDYELVFTAAPRHRDALLALSATAGVALTRIGVIRAHPAGCVALLDAAGRDLPIRARGWDHFGAQRR